MELHESWNVIHNSYFLFTVSEMSLVRDSESWSVCVESN